MKNVIIIGTGKIGIDLYIKLKKSKAFKKIYIFNRNRFSEGAKFCIKKKFLYSDKGISGVKKALKNSDIIFDCTSAKSNHEITKKLRKLIKKKFYLNLTPSRFGKYMVPYFNQNRIPNETLQAVSGEIDIDVVVGGGIRTPEDACQLVNSGASFVVIGSALENSEELISDFASAIHQ